MNQSYFWSFCRKYFSKNNAQDTITMAYFFLSLFMIKTKKIFDEMPHTQLCKVRNMRREVSTYRTTTKTILKWQLVN